MFCEVKADNYISGINRGSHVGLVTGDVKRGQNSFCKELSPTEFFKCYV